MRVLIHTHNYFPTLGGVATYCRNLAMGLAEAGDDVCLLAPCAGAVPRGLAFRMRSLPMRLAHDRIRPWHYPEAARALRRSIREERPDVILAAQLTAVYLAALVGGGQAARVVTIHGSEITNNFTARHPAARLNRAVIRAALLRADAVIAVSGYTRRLLLSRVPEVDAGRIAVVHHGIRPPELAVPIIRPAEFTEPAGPWLLSVGRIVENKGFHLVPPILARLARRLPGVGWAIAGEGPLEHAVREAAARAGVAERVRFLGWVPPERMPAYYAAADLLLHPAIPDAAGREESFGLILIEAMAQGCPVAATRVGGVPEVVLDGETGLFFNPRHPDEAAAALAELLSDPGRRRSMGERARARSQSAFSLVRMVRETRAVLHAARERRCGRR